MSKLKEKIAKELWDFEANGKTYTVAAKEIINLCMDAASKEARDAYIDEGSFEDIERAIESLKEE